MPAVVTDQFRITNAGNFVDSVLDSNNSYYVFLGLPDPVRNGFGRATNWNDAGDTPDPVDNLEYLTHYRDTSLFGKKINSSNIRRVVKKHSWIANERYDMYRHDYSTSNLSPNSKSGSLYRSNYYVITSQFKVYICIDNGGSGDPNSTDAKGKQTQIEPTFTDLQPASPGVGDPYTWKYLFTVSPSDVIKFDSTEYIVLPNDWSTTTDGQIQAVRETGNSDINKNQIQKVFIKNKGSGYTTDSGSVVKTCDILGDGEGAKCQVTVTGGEITDVVVIAGGSGYTFGMVDLSGFNASPSTFANLIPIIPPSKGHGFDIYTELGADKVLVYSRFDDSTKDFPVDTHFAQVGIIKNPNKFGTSNLYTESQFSSLFSVKLSETPEFSNPNNFIGAGIAQTVTDGTARGIVASYDSDTLVVKYIQDRSLNLNQTTNDTTDYGSDVKSRAKVLSFESGENANTVVFSGGVSDNISIDSGFSGITTTIGGRNINLGVDFTNGLANPEINKKTGEIIYIDNRKEVERDIRQKEDVKIILEF